MQKTALLIDADKCTYDDYLKITSIFEYDEKRKNLYDRLDNETIEQFFDFQDGKVKIRKA